MDQQIQQETLSRRRKHKKKIVKLKALAKENQWNGRHTVGEMPVYDPTKDPYCPLIQAKMYDELQKKELQIFQKSKSSRALGSKVNQLEPIVRRRKVSTAPAFTQSFGHSSIKMSATLGPTPAHQSKKKNVTFDSQRSFRTVGARTMAGYQRGQPVREHPLAGLEQELVAGSSISLGDTGSINGQGRRGGGGGGAAAAAAGEDPGHFAIVKAALARDHLVEAALGLAAEITDGAEQLDGDQEEEWMPEMEGLLLAARARTLDLVEQVHAWKTVQGHDVPCRYRGENLLLRVRADLAPLDGHARVARWLGFPLAGNPFLEPAPYSGPAAPGAPVPARLVAALGAEALRVRDCRRVVDKEVERFGDLAAAATAPPPPPPNAVSTLDGRGWMTLAGGGEGGGLEQPSELLASSLSYGGFSATFGAPTSGGGGGGPGEGGGDDGLVFESEHVVEGDGGFAGSLRQGRRGKLKRGQSLLAEARRPAPLHRQLRERVRQMAREIDADEEKIYYLEQKHQQAVAEHQAIKEKTEEAAAVLARAGAGGGAFRRSLDHLAAQREGWDQELAARGRELKAQRQGLFTCRQDLERKRTAKEAVEDRLEQERARIARHKQKRREAEEAKRGLAALQIQRLARGFIVRQNIQDEKMTREVSATKLQYWAKSCLARRHMAQLGISVGTHLQRRRELERRLGAVRVIQAHARRWLAVLYFKRKLKKKRRRDRQLERTSTVSSKPTNPKATGRKSPQALSRQSSHAWGFEQGRPSEKSSSSLAEIPVSQRSLESTASMDDDSIASAKEAKRVLDLERDFWDTVESQSIYKFINFANPDHLVGSMSDMHPENALETARDAMARSGKLCATYRLAATYGGPSPMGATASFGWAVSPAGDGGADVDHWGERPRTAGGTPAGPVGGGLLAVAAAAAAEAGQATGGDEVCGAETTAEDGEAKAQTEEEEDEEPLIIPDYEGAATRLQAVARGFCRRAAFQKDKKVKVAAAVKIQAFHRGAWSRLMRERRRIPLKTFKQLDHREAAAWVTSVGLELYQEKLLRARADGAWLAAATHARLMDVGIGVRVHRERLLREVEAARHALFAASSAAQKRASGGGGARKPRGSGGGGKGRSRGGAAPAPPAPPPGKPETSPLVSPKTLAGGSNQEGGAEFAFEVEGPAPGDKAPPPPAGLGLGRDFAGGTPSERQQARGRQEQEGAEAPGTGEEEDVWQEEGEEEEGEEDASARSSLLGVEDVGRLGEVRQRQEALDRKVAKLYEMLQGLTDADGTEQSEKKDSRRVQFDSSKEAINQMLDQQIVCEMMIDQITELAKSRISRQQGEDITTENAQYAPNTVGNEHMDIGKPPMSPGPAAKRSKQQFDSQFSWNSAEYTPEDSTRDYSLSHSDTDSSFVDEGDRFKDDEALPCSKHIQNDTNNNNSNDSIEDYGKSEKSMANKDEAFSADGAGEGGCSSSLFSGSGGDGSSSRLDTSVSYSVQADVGALLSGFERITHSSQGHSRGLPAAGAAAASGAARCPSADRPSRFMAPVVAGEEQDD